MADVENMPLRAMLELTYGKKKPILNMEEAQTCGSSLMKHVEGSMLFVTCREKVPSESNLGLHLATMASCRLNQYAGVVVK